MTTKHKPKESVPRPERCAWCGDAMLSINRSWHFMESDYGLLVCAPYCSPRCADMGERHPASIVSTLRSRREGWQKEKVS